MNFTADFYTGWTFTKRVPPPESSDAHPKRYCNFSLFQQSRYFRHVRTLHHFVLARRLLTAGGTGLRQKLILFSPEVRMTKQLTYYIGIPGRFFEEVQLAAGEGSD